MSSLFDRSSDVGLAPYLPLFDPEHFHDPAFFRQLERMGYRQVLLRDTGCSNLLDLVTNIKSATALQVVLYSGTPGPGADLIVLPDVVGSISDPAHPLGSCSVTTTINVRQRRLSFLPVASFVLGNSTASWFHDMFRSISEMVLVNYANYARIVGYHFFELDYNGASLDIRPELIAALRKIPDIQLLINDRFTPDRARAVLELGAHTVITPSEVYEAAGDPLALAAEFYARLLAPQAG